MNGSDSTVVEQMTQNPGFGSSILATASVGRRLKQTSQIRLKYIFIRNNKCSIDLSNVIRVIKADVIVVMNVIIGV
jgi:hypothetical protein